MKAWNPGMGFDDVGDRGKDAKHLPARMQDASTAVKKPVEVTDVLDDLIAHQQFERVIGIGQERAGFFEAKDAFEASFERGPSDAGFAPRAGFRDVVAEDCSRQDSVECDDEPSVPAPDVQERTLAGVHLRDPIQNVVPNRHPRSIAARVPHTQE